MVNMIVAIIVAGTVGFLAGHFIVFSGENPMSVKEAVTGEEDPAPAAPQPPPRTAPKPKLPPAKELLCQQGRTLQDQLSQLNLNQQRQVCDESSLMWQQRIVDTFAPSARDEFERRQFRESVAQDLRDPLQRATYYRGETSLTIGSQVLLAEVLLNFYSIEEQDKSGQPASLTVGDPAKLCYAISMMFSIDGKPADGMAASTACGDGMRRKEQAHYISWTSATSKYVGPLVSMFLVPTPEGQAPLWYLSSADGAWESAANFHWQPSNEADFQSVRDRFRKKLVDHPR